MNFELIIPIFLGTIGILQGTINKEVAEYVGVAHATLITNLVTVVMCTIFYFLVKNYENAFPSEFHIKSEFLTYRWWFIFPAIFGFLIVAGMPFAISKLGAVKVTVGLIAAQMLTSVFWDYFIEDLSLNIYKVFGIIFALLSMVMISLSKSN